jgi:hypothetical protein
VEDFGKGISTNKYGGTMPKIFTFFKNFKITKYLKKKTFRPPFFGSFKVPGPFLKHFCGFGLHYIPPSPTSLASFFTVMPKDLTTSPRSRLDFS